MQDQITNPNYPTSMDEDLQQITYVPFTAFQMYYLSPNAAIQKNYLSSICRISNLIHDIEQISNT
jgi:hypothetical protein